MKNKFKCKLCGRRTKGYSKSNLCKSCIMKEFYKNPKNHPRYIDGRSKNANYCIDCGVKISNYQHKRCRSCSQKYICTKIERKKTFPKKGKLHPSYIDGRTNKQYYCIDCGAEITMWSGVYGSGRCRSCSYKNMWKDEEYRKNHTGKNHYRYKDGLGRLPYTTKFTQKLKNKIRKRDSFICQNSECKLTEEEHLKKYNKVLEIHHINYDKENCNEYNLITLCKNCNVNASNQRDYWYAYYTYTMEKINE